MENTSRVALASQMVLRRRLDLVANNVANAGTAGFRLERQVVQTALHGAGQARVTYPLDRGSLTDLRAGTLRTTGNTLDVAVEGQGFLAVAAPGGLLYTRDGRLGRAADGTLTGAGGHPLASADGGPILVPEETASLVIAGDGTVTADDEEIGRIGLFLLPDGAAPVRRADGLLEIAGAVPHPEGRLRQGMIEESNVEPIRELAALVELQRGYERVQTILDDEHERLGKVIDRAVRV